MASASHGDSALKRSRNQEVVGTGVDLISDLPNSVLTHILSFLPAQYVMRTRILSRRWKDVWTGAPCLTFVRRDFRNGLPFSMVVNGFLDQYGPGSIEKFRINSPWLDCPVDLWIVWAITHHVKELDLTVLNLRLPGEHIFISRTLVVLKLTRHEVSMNFPPGAQIQVLKTLELDSVTSPNREFENKLISCCPVLENLSILNKLFRYQKRYRVYAPKLKCLKIFFDNFLNYRNQNRCVIDINAPILEDLIIKDSGSCSLSSANFGALSKAEISLGGSNAY